MHACSIGAASHASVICQVHALSCLSASIGAACMHAL